MLQICWVVLLETHSVGEVWLQGCLLRLITDTLKQDCEKKVTVGDTYVRETRLPFLTHNLYDDFL